MEKKTPLYDRHVQLGGKIIEFGGTLMPVQYSGLMAEHAAVREKAGIFDVSHMGEIFITGKDALKNLNHLLSNDFTNLGSGKIRYTVICNEDGGIVDDLIVYKYDDEKYMLVVNAANLQKDMDWLSPRIEGEAKIEDLSDNFGLLALQGPLSEKILTKLLKEGKLPEEYYSFHEDVNIGGIKCMVSQTGYTGEHGFEIYLDAKDTVAMWGMILDAGKDQGLIPAGLGARDTLRLEAGMPLYGHEMSDTISPLEANLGFAVKMNKPDFIGKTALEKESAKKRTRIGLKVVGRGIVREDAPLTFGGKEVGITTSGTHSPTLGYAIAVGLVERGAVKEGDKLIANVRGRDIEVEVIPLPFYKRA